MISGLTKVYPDRRDFSILHTYGATLFDIKGLPENFSIYDGRSIPNQELVDTRFTPNIRPLFYGCTGESQSFIGGLEDGALYRPDDLYENTPPFVDGQGRDMRASLQVTIDRGYKDAQGNLGNKRLAYFNCYGSGAITDADAVRIALWINQNEKRAVSVGSYFYPEFLAPNPDGTVLVPSFNTNQATMHNYIITGWKTINNKVHLEAIPWIGDEIGDKGRIYISSTIFNALMAQPYSAAFTLTKQPSGTPIPVGYTAVIDHLVAFIRNLFGV